MTQEDKELLLKDISARSPYGVIVGYSTKDNPNTLDKIGRVIYVDIRFGMIQIQVEYGISYGLSPSEFIKPYLRPMSSMTEEECDVVEEILGNKCIFDFMSNGDIIIKQGQFSQNKLAKLYDYYNLIHVDYRGLIDKGLALEAPEGMY